MPAGISLMVDEGPNGFTIKDNIISGKDWAKASSNEGLSKLLLSNLNQYPDFVGQINTKTGQKTTFAEFKDRSIRCALWLRKQGIGVDDIICTSTPLQSDDYVPIFATFFVGAIINPWHHQLNSATAIDFFSLIKPKIMFASEQSIDLLIAAAKDAKVNCKFVVFGNHPGYQSLTNLMAQQSQNEVDSFHLDHKNPQIGGMIFTSGTTGNQKCTLLSYNTLLNNRMNYIPVHEGMKVLWYSSFSWITGLVCIISCVKFRFTRILHTEFDAEETSSIIEKYKVSWAFLTPTMMAHLYYGNVYKRYDYSELKLVITCGSKPKKQILEKTRKALPHCLVANSFGMTEMGGLATIQGKSCKVVDSIGYVVGGVSLKVIDPTTGSKLGPNENGEICVKVDYVMLGYLNNEEGTKSEIDEEGWLHTGDLGYYSEDGEIVILDRLKQVIITRNYHIAPSQIEEILLQHPAVVDVAVISVPHEIDIEVPIAFVVKKAGVNVTEEELIELPATHNEFFRLTGGVIFIDKIPHTTNGKKNVKELKERVRAIMVNNNSPFLISLM